MPDLIRSETITFSNSERIMFANTGPSADPKKRRRFVHIYIVDYYKKMRF